MSSLLNLFIEYAKKKNLLNKAFLIGGSVRDIIINKNIHDIDITLTENTFQISKDFSKEISGSFIVLDQQNCIIRVAKNGHFIDFCELKGSTILDDLSQRDFTINAMAVNLFHFSSLYSNNLSFESKLLNELIIDPFNGLRDIKYKTIKMVSEQNLVNDPLRLLRAYRFATSLDFQVDINTYHAICKHSKLISKVAVERINVELREILKNKFSYKTIRELRKTSLLLNTLQEISYLSNEILDYNIRVYTYLEHIMNNLLLYFPSHHEYFQEYFLDDYKKICLKITTLFSSIKLAKLACERLKLSKKELNFIETIENFYDLFLKLKKENKPKKIEFLNKAGVYIYPLSILAIAKELICCPNENSTLHFCYEIIDIYHREFLPKKKLLPLITGYDLIEEFNLDPSPFFKTILNEIELLFLKGEISSKKEAFEVIKSQLNKGLR